MRPCRRDALFVHHPIAHGEHREAKGGGVGGVSQDQVPVLEGIKALVETTAAFNKRSPMNKSAHPDVISLIQFTAVEGLKDDAEPVGVGHEPEAQWG